MKNPFNQIATFENYVEIIGIPKEQLQSEEVQNRINKWLIQATEQFDSMISGNGKLGRLYRWFNALENNEEDNYKKYKLIKAICSWVETFVIKGKFWVDGLPVINSNVDIQINSSSNDSNVEMKRKDIIQDLVSIGLYQTTNFGDSNTYQDNQQNANKLIEELVVLSKNELNNDYLKVHPQKPLQGNLDFANNDLVNGGNIIGSTQQARNKIQYYNILDSTIDLSKNNIIGSIPIDPTQIEGINKELEKIKQEQIIQNIDIQANRTALTQIEEIDEAQNIAIETNLNNINTIKTDLGDLGNQVVDVQNKTNANTTKIQQNTTNITTNTTNIQNNTNNIQTNTTNITALDGRLVSVSSLLNDTINGLKTLKPFQYVGEYQAGTTYRINQAVSLNNNLYLSKEDNNTTTPPGNKWLLLNEDFATIDLTQYYTKLEVNAIRDNLQNSINTNATNITTIRNNYLDKTSTSKQDIKGSEVHFKGNVLVNSTSSPTLTPGHDLIVNGSTMTDELVVNNNTVLNTTSINTATINGRLTMGNTSTAQLDGTTNIRIGNINHANIVEGTIQTVGTQPNSLVDKQYVDNAVNNNTPSVSNAVLTTGDQTISGTKTFNSPLVFPNRRISTTTNDNITVAHINAQAQKYIKFDFEQTTGGFQNYGWLQMNAKYLTNAWSEIFSIGFKNQDNTANQGVWMNCSHNKFSFGNQTKVSNVEIPTNDFDAANKRYVDDKVANPGEIYSGTLQVVTSNNSSLVNKEYVDSKIGYSILVSSAATFSNLQTFSIQLPGNIDSLRNKPWIIKFDRMGRNGSQYEGTFNHSFMLPEINQATFVDEKTYYHSGNKRFEEGARAGIRILRTTNSNIQLMFQLWDSGNRITNFTIYTPK